MRRRSQSNGSQINGSLCAWLTDDVSHTRVSAALPSCAQHPCLPRPLSSRAGLRRPARDLQEEVAFFTHAEIALPLASRIDFRYGARATEPARAPTSVALRSGLLSLWSAHPSQDGRAGPRRWTLQWPRKGVCCVRRAAGPYGGCGWSQLLTPGAIRAS